MGILVFLFLSGSVLSVVKRNAPAGRRLLLCGGIMFLTILFSPLAQLLMLNLEREYPPLLAVPASSQARHIVILSGYAEENPGFPVTSNVSEQTLCNLSEGLRLYRLVPGAKIITSGGVVRQGDKPMAGIMADFLQQMGVPFEDLIIEGNSQTTYENMLEVRKLLGTEQFFLVAPACDMRRAVGVALKLKMDLIPAPSYIWTLQHYPRDRAFRGQAVAFLRRFAQPSIANFSRLQWACHEYLGYAWYRMLGRI